MRNSISADENYSSLAWTGTRDILYWLSDRFGSDSQTGKTLCRCQIERSVGRLIVTNTMFKQKDERKTTWMHPRSKHWHMIDFIISRCRDKMDIHSTRVMRGANCWTDHQMLRSKVAFRIRQKHNRQGTSKPTKLNIAKLSTTSHRESFGQEMDSALAQWEEKENSTPDEEWEALQQVVYNTAKTYLGKPDRKHQDWFDPND